MDFSKQKPSFFSSHYWEYKSIQLADKVVVVSKTLEKIAISIKGEENVMYIPNGVDSGKFNSSKKKIGKDRIIVGVVGYIGKIGDKFAYKEMAIVSKKIAFYKILL